MAVIDDEEEKAAILNAKRGFIEATPTPISYEVFLHRLKKGDINREAISGYLAEVWNMGLHMQRVRGACSQEHAHRGDSLQGIQRPLRQSRCDLQHCARPHNPSIR
jgi:hypothetical protein